MLDLIYNNAQKNINNINFSVLKNKKILITGASGLIGIHCLAVLNLLKQKFKIDVYCWVNNDIDPNFLPMFKDCVIIKGDITDENKIKILEEQFVETLSGFDFIIHAAGYGQPKKFMTDKIKTINLNINSTLNLFKLLNSDGSFLFCSTSELYSGLEEEKITELKIGTTLPDHPRACYIEGKRCGEALCHAFKDNGYNVKIARISLAYGPGTKKNDDRVLNNLIQKGLEQNEINMLDDGSSVRTYGYISDITEMLWNILLNGKEVVYNVGGVSKLSILDLANSIAKKINCNVVLPTNNTNKMIGNPKIVNISLDKYLKEFGDKSFIDINCGLDDTIEWQRKLYINDKNN